MPTAKSTTYRARTHRLRGEAKTPAAKSAKAKKPATKKSKKPELTPRMKEFVKLAKARKEREFFEKLTDAELNTFAKALISTDLSDSRQKKLKAVIAYSKKTKSALILINTSVVAASVMGMAAPLLYLLVQKRREAKAKTEASPEQIAGDKKDRLDDFDKMVLGLSAAGFGLTVLSASMFSEKLKEFKRFQKALRALK
jgi:hypothetical protein